MVDFFESLLVTILLALFGTTFIVQAFKIPSESMEPTLAGGRSSAGEQVCIRRAPARGMKSCCHTGRFAEATSSFSSFPSTIIRTT